MCVRFTFLFSICPLTLIFLFPDICTCIHNSPDTSFHRWLEQHGKDAKDAEPTKEDFQRWLTVAETELGGLAKAHMTVFTGGEWWVEGHGDYIQATRALHCIQLQQLCKELKKSKAVFTPHIPGTVKNSSERKKFITLIVI